MKFLLKRLKTYELNSPFLWFLTCVQINCFILCLKVINIIFKIYYERIPGDLRSDISRNKAYMIRLYVKKTKNSEYILEATEWWLNGTEWWLNGDWMATEIYQPLSWLKGTERSLNGAFQFSIVAFRLVSCVKLFTIFNDSIFKKIVGY